MHNPYVVALCSIFFLCFNAVLAQKSVNASGGNATGTGGSSSYSVGQIIYQTDSGSNGSSAEGVQQPYEIFVLRVNELIDFNLDVSVYPNPTLDQLKIRTEAQDQYQSLTYQLMDKNGKALLSGGMPSMLTTIDLNHLAASTYFLQITSEKTALRTFKIIKN